MTSTDDDRTLREAFASLAGDARSGEGCPPPERLWAAIEGEAPIDERLELVDHIATCPSCAADWRAAYRMGARPPAWWRVTFRRLVDVTKAFSDSSGFVAGIVPGPDGSARVVRVSRKALILVVTSFLLLSSLILVMTLAGPGKGPAYRGLEPAIPLEVPLSRQDCRLKWVGLEGAVYDLTVKTESLEAVVVLHGLVDPQHLIAEERLKNVESGEHLLWLVEATLPSGQRISQVFSSELK